MCHIRAHGAHAGHNTGFEHRRQMRILLDNMSKMLRGIITDIVSSDPECEIVAEAPRQDSLRDRLDETHVDVVILAADNMDDEPGRYGDILADHPTTRIIAITSAGNRAFLYELRPHVTLIDELSPARLLSAIKQPPDAGWRTVGQ